MTEGVKSCESCLMICHFEDWICLRTNSRVIAIGGTVPVCEEVAGHGVEEKCAEKRDEVGKNRA